MALNPNFPENQIIRKAWNLYTDLYGAESDIEPHGHAYLAEYSAIGNRIHVANCDAMKKYGEFSIGHQSAAYVVQRAAEAEYLAAMDRYFAAVEELENAA